MLPVIHRGSPPMPRPTSEEGAGNGFRHPRNAVSFTFNPDIESCSRASQNHPSCRRSSCRFSCAMMQNADILGAGSGGQGEQPHSDGEPVLPTTIPPGLELLNSAAKQIPVQGCDEYFIYSILGSRLPCLPFSRGVVVWAHSSHPTATRTLGG